MATIDNMLLLEERVRRAVSYIEKLRKESEQLKRDLKLVSSHNQELQAYADNFKEDEAKINLSIQNSLDSLNAVGLDNLGLDDLELDAAEQFSSIGGASIDMDGIEL